MASLADRAQRAIRIFDLHVASCGGWKDGVGVGHDPKESAVPSQLLPADPIGEEAELPNAHKPAGQDVKEKAANELDGVERHGPGLVAARIVFVREAHAPIVQRQKALV